MFLSRVLATGPACRNPYEIHRALWTLFPRDAGASRDFLFRIERSDMNRAKILVQSFRRPTDGGHSHIQLIDPSKEYSLPLLEGQRLRFLLVGNPVKTIGDEKGRKDASGGPKKCRVPLIRDEERRAWIERKLGFVADLETLLIDPGLPLHFQKEGMAGKIQPVVFKGILGVREPEGLARIIRQGIGPAKAFGCGLLSLAKG